MEKYNITSDTNNETHEFLVGQFPYGEGETCKYRVFFNGELVAILVPDQHHILHVRKELKNFDDELLNLLADEVEDRHPNIISCTDN